VRALLRALTQQDENAALAARIEAAAHHIRREDAECDLGALGEAKRWLSALAGSGDEARLREQVALSTEADFWDPRADRVSLLTMHAAKGLEFSVVFVVGMEDGLTPFSWGVFHDEARDEDDSRDTTSEERRLFYVAMTRAKDRLYLSRASQRNWRGQIRTLPASPYLDEIAPELITREIAPKRKKRVEARQYSLF
jgi:superfamily I DNA/RNA helicase